MLQRAAGSGTSNSPKAHRAASRAWTTSFGWKRGQRRRELHSFISGEGHCDGGKAAHASAEEAGLCYRKKSAVAPERSDCELRVMHLYDWSLCTKFNQSTQVTVREAVARMQGFGKILRFKDVLCALGLQRSTEDNPPWSLKRGFSNSYFSICTILC